MSEKLKPCPFCGGSGHVLGPREDTTVYDRFIVECFGCEVFRGGETRDEAIVAWNTRANVEHLLEALEPLARVARQEDGIAEKLGNPLRADTEILIPMGRWTPPVTLGESRAAVRILDSKKDQS